MLSSVKRLDFFSKTLDDFRVKTFYGGALSLVALILISLLTISEFLYYLEVHRVDVLSVDQSKGQAKIPIYLDITFPRIPCEAVTLDVMDVSGEHQRDVEHSFFRQRLDLTGRELSGPKKAEALGNSEEELELAEKINKMKEPGYCGSCYSGSGDKCCNTCEEVRAEYKRLGWAFRPGMQIEQCYEEMRHRESILNADEGCRIKGEFLVRRVAGNFHIAPGRSLHTISQHVHEFSTFEVSNFNTSHIIHSLGFGLNYPGLQNPLDGVEKYCIESVGLYQYFIKVVPTLYEDTKGEELQTNQYSVTTHFRPRDMEHQNVVPAIYFMYDLSPIMVHVREERKSFFRFLTSLCAIIGGIYSVSGLLDGLLFHFSKERKNKPRSVL